MKILVCVDGSEHSQKALEMAAKIGVGCNTEEVLIIYVYDSMSDIYLSFLGDEGGSVTEEQMENMRKAMEMAKKDKKKILSKASEFFKKKGIISRTIFKEGHPSHTIINVAHEEKVDMIVIGSRGLSGLKKVFLGSVSNAVVQEVKDCSVLVVK